MITNCEFLNPVYWDASINMLAPLNRDTKSTPWNYMNMNCSTTEPIINNGEMASTTAGFTYGEIISTTFLFMIFLVAILGIFIVSVSGIKTKNKYNK